MLNIFSFNRNSPNDHAIGSQTQNIDSSLQHIIDTSKNAGYVLRAKRILKARVRVRFRAISWLWILPGIYWYFDGVDAEREELIAQKLSRCIACSNDQITQIISDVNAINSVYWNGWFDMFYLAVFILFSGVFLYSSYWWTKAHRLIKSDLDARAKSLNKR